MRARLRPAYTPERLGQIYAQPHRHDQWPDHLVRVAVTIDLARALAGRPATAADLSCGDAAILKALDPDTTYLGDYAPGYQLHGPIEETITQIPRVDLFVCSETLEHLDDPDKVLHAIRGRAASLILSTPVDCWNDPNPEHYWAWSREDVEDMLATAGWQVAFYTGLDLRPTTGAYCFGIWGCR
jgi:hypothetical protein